MFLRLVRDNSSKVQNELTQLKNTLEFLCSLDAGRRVSADSLKEADALLQRRDAQWHDLLKV
jgi:uncharacterized protein YjaG (DUF416 family)